jgi:hypothetical protein
MKLIKLSIFIAALAFLGSCQMAKFDRVPGEELNNIPVELHGKYALLPSESKGLLGSDSMYLIIENSSIQVISKTINFTKIHNQDFKASMFRKKILLALNDATVPALWNIVIIENLKGSLRIYPLLDMRSTADGQTKMGNYIPQQISNITTEPIPPPQNPMTESGAAPINSPNQGLPSRIFFYMMMEDQFEQYLNNEVIAKEYFQFNKVEAKAKKK